MSSRPCTNHRACFGGSKATQRRGLSTELADAFAHADSEPLWYRLGAGVNDSYKPDHLEPMKLTRVRDNHVDLGSISPDHAAPSRG